MCFSIIEDYLGDEMYYVSMWILHEMISNKEYYYLSFFLE